MWNSGQIGTDHFLLGPYRRLKKGGYWKEPERVRNLTLCINAKTLIRNSATLTRNYSEWWLIFDDHIGFGSAFDVPEQMNIQHGWNKVILINPLDPTQAYELPLKS